jgi:hypothetical protein
MNQPKENVAVPIEDLLSQALSNAITLYLSYAEQDVQISLEENDFQNYQKGCKAAISNIESLLKLTKILNQDVLEEGEKSHLSDYIAIAEKNIAEHDEAAIADLESQIIDNI